LITAELAEKLGRDLAAVPGPISAPGSAGPHALLRDGATLVRSAQDVLDALFGVGGAPSAPRQTAHAGLDPRLVALLDAVRSGRDTVAALSGTSPETAEAVIVGLTELELRELIRREAGGRYVVRL
jgi:DNA processing protein